MNTYLYLLLILLLCIGCNESAKKKYEDYNDKDFIEVQGILTRSFRKTKFPDRFESDIYFIYNLDKDKPNKGYELGSPYMLDEGEPVIILVHHSNEAISFFGSRGIIEEEVLLKYLDKCNQIGGGYYGVEDDLSKY